MSPWYIVKLEEISHIFDLATPDIFKMDRHTIKILQQLWEDV